MSAGDIIVGVAVMVIVAMAVISLIHAHLSGKCSCGCENCGECCRKTVEIQDDKN